LSYLPPNQRFLFILSSSANVRASASKGVVKDLMASSIPSPDLSLAGHSAVPGSPYENVSSASELSFRPLQKIRRHKAKVNIKPLLKGRSRDDSSSASIDLSRSSLEHEDLGIYTNLERDRRYVDNWANISGHYRSVSEPSPYSTTTVSSANKHGLQYVHPKRQKPRPFTPALSQSYDRSIGRGYLMNEDRQLRDVNLAACLHFDTESHLIPENSVTAALSPEQELRERTNSSRAMRRSKKQEILLAPRNSLDRPKVRTSIDSLSHAATVQAARQAFEEKEAAKTLKLEMERMKARHRELQRRKKRKEQEHDTFVDGCMTRPTPEGTGSFGIVDPHEAFGAGPSRHCSTENRQMSGERPEANNPATIQSRSKPSTSKRSWTLFLTWVRTRIFKLRRRSCGIK
jgi:hypothetical protein